MKYFFRLCPAFSAALCAAFCAVILVSGCSKDDVVPLLEKVRTGTLPSGLKYYILENKKPENRAFLTLAINAGSVLEEDDEQGIAHFVEHIAFNATERFPDNEVVEYLRSIGMRFGADVNAYTSFDRTVYGIEVPTSNKEIPQRALEIIDDWTRAILFNKKDVDEERPIILEEYRARLGARERSSRELRSLLFEGSKYALRHPIGKLEVIENAPAERLESFYKKWYRPGNMAVIFTGDFDGEALEAQLANNFRIEAPVESTDIPLFELPPPQKGAVKAKIFTDPEITQTYITFYYKMNWTPQESTMRYYKNQIIDNLIDTIISERWTDAEHKSDTPYFSAYTGKWRSVRRSLHFALGGSAKQGQFREAFAALLAEKEKLLRYGVLKSELERAKTALLSELETALAEKEKRDSSNYASEITENFLSNESFPGIEWEVDAAKKILPNISIKDLSKVIKNYFEGDDVLVFVTANSAEENNLPAEDELVALVAASKKAKIERPIEAALSSTLLDETPRAGSITNEKKDEPTDSLIWTLSNGARVILKQTTNQNDQIILTASARGGTTASPIEHIVSAKLAQELASASGLGKYTLPELNKMLAGKQVSMSFNTAYFSRGIDGSSTQNDLKTFFEILYLGFTSPRHDEETAQIIKDEYRTILAQRRENPESYFSEEVLRLIYNNPYIEPLEPEDLDKLSVAQSAAWTTRARNVSDYVFCFAGNIDIEKIRPLIETYLASVPPSLSANESISAQPALKIEFPQTVDKILYKGKEDKSVVFLGHFLSSPWNLEENMTAEILNEYLEITLTQEIREKLGGVYGIDPDVSIGPAPPPGALRGEVYFNCAPARVEELTNAVEAEFAKVAAGNINPDTFEKARSALIKNWERSMEQNSYISRRLSGYMAIFNIPLETLVIRDKLYSEVTPAKVEAMMSSLMKRGLVRAVLYPGK